MLGGLARWLRAAGYDAEFDAGIDDAPLVARARECGAMLLSSDGGIFQRNVVKNGTVRALFVPRGGSRLEQLAFVMHELHLKRREIPRCMSCGGELSAVEKESVRPHAPPQAFASCRNFWRCRRCGKLFWDGTHWRRISESLSRASGKQG